MKKMKLTIQDTGPFKKGDGEYVVVGALNTIEWGIGEHLSRNEVAAILCRTGVSAVDVSVKEFRG